MALRVYHAAGYPMPRGGIANRTLCKLSFGKLLGHTKMQTTARYAHLARDSVRDAAARVAASIGADLAA